MEDSKILNYVKDVLENMPASWLGLTTHRLDIYDEALAKTQFLEKFEALYKDDNSSASALSELPTAFDYIRLGHPLSCVLEWVVANLNGLASENVISFSSKTIPVLAILRKNLFDNKNTKIFYTGELPKSFDVETLRGVYGYKFDLEKVEKAVDILKFKGSSVLMSQKNDICDFDLKSNVDFFINTHSQVGSLVLVNTEQAESYVSEIQHVRRRETIAMTPASSLEALRSLIGESTLKADKESEDKNKELVISAIQKITGTDTKALLGSCGLSVQYSIMMGLVHDAMIKHKGKDIKIIVPPNCYGGTNDQARRLAACLDNVEVLDLPVDGDNEMVQSLEVILSEVAHEDAVPFIIAEIPTNPRVEVPELIKLKNVLSEERMTRSGGVAVDPVFILDQTFCPNFLFLGEDEALSKVRTISYVSGSKFPSGGLCTAGYCVANKRADDLMGPVENHLKLCDNEATALQLEVLAKQMPSMNQRIADAYKNTREFVSFITETLPEAKINFVSGELAEQGFTPSVFSLDLPAKNEEHKRELNHKLIKMMIEKIPDESKHCVSYGQLKGCYWTIPATSTQGTTKEGDKDYIVRVAVAPDMNVELHKKVFAEFINTI